ncbi:MAG: SLBB domain-containing protein, partial [Synergistaceae bacterium]|nr:SLBB domain-containing protein [Synergistaceae bacterium]
MKRLSAFILCMFIILAPSIGISFAAADATASAQAPASPIQTGIDSAPVESVQTASAAGPALPAPDLSQSLDGEGVSTAEVNQYFDQMLDTAGVIPNPVGSLLRKLPRYGMSFFKQPSSTYAPVDKVPVSSGYILGPDDELVITLWGMIEGNYNVKINRDGQGIVPHIGSVRLAGYTLEEAKRALKDGFDKYFTDYKLNVSMGALRAVTVYVTGDVRRPGAYTVSSFATLVNALLASGGPSGSGTLRAIQLKRGGITITTFDMYDLLLKGDKTKDVRLQAEDVIFVPPVGPLVGLAGELRRPGVYELKGSTTLDELLYLAGGISAQTFKGRVQYYKIQDSYYRSVFEGSVAEMSRSILADGDVLRLFPVIDIPTFVRISGPVGRPGTYGVTPGVTRVSDLISQAGGLLVTASERAELTRVTPTQGGPVTTRLQINVHEALRGSPSDNIPLQLNDYLMVHIIPEWETQRIVRVTGEVMYPGTYAVIKGERISDLLRRCGGFTPKASLRGTMFTRRRVAVEQRKEMNRVADQLERDLTEAESSTPGDRSAQLAAQESDRRRELIDRLRNVDIPGRVVVKLDVPDAMRGTVWDVELEDGDAINVPEAPSTVEVMGAVYSASSHIFNQRMG